MQGIFRFLFLAFTAVQALGDALEDGRDLRGRASTHKKYSKTLRAYVTHGVNAFNGKKIFDFNESSRIFSGLPALEDIGVWNPEPNASNATSISKDTPEDSQMASMFPTLFNKFMGARNPDPIGPFNIPIFATPTFTPRSMSITDRHEPAKFEDSGETAKQGNYAAHRRGNGLTLEKYNSARGWMRVVCSTDGTARFKIRMQGIPLGLYTAWDIIVKNSLTESESLMVSPFGGAPNVIATDRRGYGQMSRKLMYCPLKKCMGSDRCTIGVIMLYHLDHMVYGSGSDLGIQGYGVGNAAANHLMFVTNGKVVKDSAM